MSLVNLNQGNRRARGSLLILFSTAVLVCGCSTSYKFEADQEKYSTYFKKERPEGVSIDSDMEYHNNYYLNANSISSIRFPSDDSKTWINIEHLVKAVEYDVKLLKDLDGEDYLFSAIEFHQDLKVRRIHLAHSYAGEALQAFRRCIYTYPRNEDGSINRKKRFVVKEAESDSVSMEGQFIYVTIYRIPLSKLRMALFPKRFWFGKGMKETIEIEYEDNGKPERKKYEFELKWIRRAHWVT